MAGPRRGAPRFYDATVRRKLEVATAMAWESLVEAHVDEARIFIHLLAAFEPIEESLPRYLREMDLTETMALAVRTRVLTAVEETPDPPPPVPAGASEDGNGDGAWALLRQPQRMVRDVMRRQRRSDELERISMLALARAEENLIGTHVENAIGFVALLEDQPLHRSVQAYLGAINLAGGRAQTVFQRTMARLADVHLPA
jgi:hypothetical protein